jgi:hypothetical protein
LFLKFQEQTITTITTKSWYEESSKKLEEH